ncbi:hypothetical protein [Teredinibacter purpureus]|uniref:hypothetical protein n=1 Tax=Teredinibacter purpureus TaxID=2731756 RepID=UPI0005F7A77A|nr:hypothetical protein [Teredinibacter purpureus]
MNKVVLVILIFCCAAGARSTASAADVVVGPEIFDLIAQDKAAGEAWLFYAYALGLCEDPNSPSFDCEVGARKISLEQWVKYSKDSKSAKDVYFSELLKVVESGFIAEYVKHFLYQERWGEVKAPQYREYLDWAKDNIPMHRIETKLHARYE